MKNIPRLVIAATQSGAGKTTIVTGLLAALRQRGLNVQSFKAGPDYIDPGYHALASGQPAHNLDSWLTPKEILPEILAAEAESADIAIVEGVMGLYDGGRQGISSTAEIAKIIKAPVLLVIDAKSMGASAAAIAQGFRDYDPSVKLAGVILNRLGSDTHEAMIREAMAGIDMPVYGALRRNDGLRMPERHLGLVPVEENKERELIGRMGEAVAGQLDLDKLLALARSAEPLAIKESSLSGAGAYFCRIGVAKDEAFSFYYPASLKVLAKLGAEIVPFSPLHDEKLPAVDGLFIGGGFPEMFAGQLAANSSMRQAVRQAAQKDMPILAECGGYMYLMDSLQDFAGVSHPMAGVFVGQAVMTEKLQMVGYVEAELQKDSLLGKAGTKLKGHEFHFSKEREPIQQDKAPFIFRKLRNNSEYPAGQQVKNVLGSYLHLHFAGCLDAAENFVRQCAAYKKKRGQVSGEV
ncbi:MAG: cobyrinate a,c-diamide synthase [Selenomonas ruminantium]|jgi:cobyrinic acid a,c-diamide synthase|uniref:Cobyrinate a,c-diamide synthase n=1 Tax=Selenomonas ruminantium TaxID=971 RepID=A0A927WG18_SELRU|nr:cobyrinate a,c-diamide synthase [Selenomonas ruminantium]MBE6086057.1 cobyrinate a,c-diamide synthase [Selenomonas ruminantium]